MWYINAGNMTRFLVQMRVAFREFTIPKTAQDSNLVRQAHLQEDAIPRFKVSLQDLKLISSALLVYRKKLANNREMEKAKQVAELDNRLYQLITDLENEQMEIREKILVS